LGFKKKGFLKLSLIALLFLGLIVAWLGFGEHGFINLYRMEKERQVYQAKIRRLEKANQELLEQINRLRNDNEYIEKVARRELGLVKKDEIIFRFSNEHDGVTRQTRDEKASTNIKIPD